MESKFAASQSYGLDKSRFHFVDSAFDVVLGLASNLLGWMPWLWDVSAGLVAKWGLGDRGGDIPTSLVFVGLTLVIQVSECLQARTATANPTHAFHAKGALSFDRTEHDAAHRTASN